MPFSRILLINSIQINISLKLNQLEYKIQKQSTHQGIIHIRGSYNTINITYCTMTARRSSDSDDTPLWG